MLGLSDDTPQIMMHLFCTFMDHQLPDIPNTGGKPFTHRHFVVFPATPDPKLSSVIIYQRHIHPPHFEIIGYNEKWPVHQVTLFDSEF